VGNRRYPVRGCGVLVLDVRAASGAVGTCQTLKKLKGVLTMHKFGRLALALPIAAAVALSSVVLASASTGSSLSVAPTVALTARIEVVVMVTASCPSGAYTMGSQVAIEEAVSKQIAHGNAYIPGLQCTGAAQTYPVVITADPTGPPFKKGSAIVTATFSWYDYTTGTFDNPSVTTAVDVD
jgi:hypothetical protein